jgi:hypothetical protein
MHYYEFVVCTCSLSSYELCGLRYLKGVSAIEIINNTRGGIEDEIWERGNGWQIEILDQHHTIFGLHLQPEKFKTRVTKLGVLYVLHVISTNITPKF